jgi:hypothetical protein
MLKNICLIFVCLFFAKLQAQEFPSQQDTLPPQNGRYQISTSPYVK